MSGTQETVGEASGGQAGEPVPPRVSRAPAQPPAPSARPGRCSVHHGSARVGTCSFCGRALCLTCAIPVRGRLIGAECLDRVVEDPPEIQVQGPLPKGGDRLAAAAFGLVLLLTVFPWTRFEGGHRYFEAWTFHWSFLAAAAGAVGFAFAMLALYRPRNPWLESAVYAGCAGAVALGALLYRHHPPLLTRASLMPSLALLGGAVALVGVVVKLAGTASSRR